MLKYKPSNLNEKLTAYEPSDPLLTASEAAMERRQAVSTFWRDVKNGAVPQPYYVGAKSPRWRLSEIRASVEATRKSSIATHASSNR